MWALRTSVPLLKGKRLGAPRSFYSSVKCWGSRRYISSTAKQTQSKVYNSKYKDRNIQYVPDEKAQGFAQYTVSTDMKPLDKDFAVKLARRYVAMQKESSGGWEQRLCKEFNIQPMVLTNLACALSTSDQPGRTQLAASMMKTAFKLGDDTATFCIITASLSGRGSLDAQTINAALQRLGFIAKNDENPEAMAILGKVLVSQDKKDEALKWFRKATDRSEEALEFSMAAHAFVEGGRLLLERDDRKGAEALFRRAADELDDPSACFYLAKTQEDGSREQQEYYTKAAAAGIIEASHNLGQLELSKAEQEPEGDAKALATTKAAEWFEVAAAGGFGWSMLNLASLCKSWGHIDNAITWLKRAEELPDAHLRLEAKSIRLELEETSED